MRRRIQIKYPTITDVYDRHDFLHHILKTKFRSKDTIRSSLKSIPKKRVQPNYKILIKQWGRIYSVGATNLEHNFFCDLTLVACAREPATNSCENC